MATGQTWLTTCLRCAAVLLTIGIQLCLLSPFSSQVLVEDRAKKSENMRRSLQGFAVMTGALLCGAMLLLLVASHIMPSVCKVADHLCQTTHIQVGHLRA